MPLQFGRTYLAPFIPRAHCFDVPVDWPLVAGH